MNSPRGGQEKCREAGVTVGGGHSVVNKEPQFGLSVTGMLKNAHQVWRNNSGQPGAHLFMTKSIGTGILTNAFKSKFLDMLLDEKHENHPHPKSAVMSDRERILTAFHDNMRTLNKYSYQKARELEKEKKILVEAATDITGFGLLGHIAEMLTPDGAEDDDAGAEDKPSVAAELIFDQIPVLEMAKEVARKDVTQFPGGSRNNLKRFGGGLKMEHAQEWQKLLLADAMTSGGLILAVRILDGSSVSSLADALGAAHIGQLVAGPAGEIRVV